MRRNDRMQRVAADGPTSALDVILLKNSTLIAADLAPEV